ncbi:MAG: lysophospholipid acyltransferase family protein [Bacteroidota bacterium]
MLRTVFFFVFLWLSLLMSLFLLLPLPVFYAGGFIRLKRKYIWFFTHYWSRFILFLAGTDLKVINKEKIPDTLPFVVLSNHQGFMDIPVLMAVFPYPLSFLAKRELLSVPLINLWLISLQCLTINRKKPFKAHKKLSGRLRHNNLNPLVIFPEGTRSRSPKEGIRKKGGIHLVEESGIPVVYVRILGTYKIWEEERKVKPAEVEVKISVRYEKAER